MDRWEYISEIIHQDRKQWKIDFVRGGSFVGSMQDILNQLGGQGWEAISLNPYSFAPRAGGHTEAIGYRLTCKRKLYQ